MSLPRPSGLTGLPRNLYRRARAGRRAREELRFRSSLRFDSSAPELVISPHWDDAVLGCWGLLASGRELNVLNLFAGIPTNARAGIWEAIIGAADPAERARRRMAEDALALARAGREATNVPLLDDQYRRQTGAGAPGLGDIDRAVTERVQSAARVYVPAGIGAHPDHLLARRYGRMLLAGGMPVTLYAELPYCIFHGWPSWVDGSAQERGRDVDVYWTSFLKDVPELPPLRSAVVERLDRQSAQAKYEAIDRYQTSLNYAARRLLGDPEFHGTEVRWALEEKR